MLLAKFPDFAFELGLAALNDSTLAPRGLPILEKAITLPANFSRWKELILEKKKAQAYEYDRALRKKLPDPEKLARYNPGGLWFEKAIKVPF